MFVPAIGWVLLAASATAGDATSKPSAFPPVTLEAEGQRFTNGQVQDADGASAGKAVLLDRVGASLTLTVDVPAGAYSVQVRAKAKDADTFNELVPAAGGHALRSIYPTNSVFTRMKGHFQRSTSGPVTLRFTLGRGTGVIVDQIRVFRQNQDYRFKTLKPLFLTTTLADRGEPNCRIVLPDDGSCKDVAERLSAAIAERCGKRPAILSAGNVDADAFKRWHLILLGDICSNIAILRTSPRSWAHIARPDGGESNLMTIHNPHGTGKNVIVVGGRDAETVGKAADALIRRLPDSPTVTVPRIWLPAWPQPMPRNQLETLMVESGKWIRQGAIRTLQNRWKAKGIEGFRLLGYRYVEYKESADTITQRRDDGFSDAEFFKVIAAWDRWEEDPYFTDAERLELTDAMWKFFGMCIDPYGRYVARGQHLELPQIVERVRAAKPEIRHNHQTFPAMSFAYAADYFGKYYDLPESDTLAALAGFVFDGQRPCAKPQCDASGYQTITMIHMFRYAVAQGDWAYVNSPQVRQFLKLRFMSHDNQGMRVGYGDSGGYIGQPDPDWRQPESYAGLWLTGSAGGFDHRRIDPAEMLGVYVHPLEPAWHQKYKGEPPVEQCFDKISFRAAYEPKRAYLLLDGLSRGYHGHWDGNSLLRFTDNGRIWLCEGDYLNGDLKDHNTVTIVKDGTSGRPPICSTLISRADLSGLGATCTRTDDYCGMTWDRHVLWHKADDAFVLIDRLTARSAATFDLKCRFRTLGDVHLGARSLEIEQIGDERFFIRSASACKHRLSDDERDGKKNWSKYPYAKPVTRLYVQQAVQPLEAGQTYDFVNVMYAAGPGESTSYEALSMGPGVAVLTGSEPALVGIDRFEKGGRSIRARQFWISAKGVYVVGLSEIRAEAYAMTAKPAVDVAWSLDEDIGTLRAPRPAKVSLVLPLATEVTVDGKTQASEGVDTPITLNLESGKHTVSISDYGAVVSAHLTTAIDAAAQEGRKRLDTTKDEAPGDMNTTEAWRAALPSPVTALIASDLNRDGADEIVVGCGDGALKVIDATGHVTWSNEFPAQVNALDAADVDGDGATDLVVGVENETVYVMRSGGKAIWSHRFEPYRQYKAHVRVVHVADFDADGSMEVAVGCANSYFYVLDKTGKLRVDKDGSRWEMRTYHQASAIGTADVDGDKHLELLAGCTYFARYIRSFHRRHGSRLHALSGCISGCGTLTSADVDGDGHREAVFADKDGRVAAAEKGGAYKAKVLWERFIGDDEIAKVLSGDVDTDGKPDLLVASRSGFLARLSAADGKVVWLHYGQADMTDAALADLAGDARLEAIGANLDGCVYVCDAAGKLVAQRQLGGPVTRLTTVRPGAGARALAVAATDSGLVAVRCR